MRNIFDQYSQPENRLTHALATTLKEDPKLLKEFVRWIVESSHPDIKKLEVLVQSLLGQNETFAEAELDQKGLPDAWIHDGDQWAIVVESKVADSLKSSQLTRHFNTARSRGFENIFLVGIDTKKPKKKFQRETKFILWSEVYAWFYQRIESSEWARRLTQYMEIAEIKMINDGYLKQGSLTTFTGFPFGSNSPYDYLEAKRLLQLAMEQIRQDKKATQKLNIDPKIIGRPAITGKGASYIWDFLSIKGADQEKNFTKFPHFTLSIEQSYIYAVVIIPNGVKPQFRKKLFEKGEKSFYGILEKVLQNLNPIINKTGASPWVEIWQRHYKTQRSKPTVDARLSFDIRTAFSSKNKPTNPPIKTQPLWLKAAYESFSNKKGNYQLGVGAIFPYDQCPITKDKKILQFVTDTWSACRPLLKVMMEDQYP